MRQSVLTAAAIAAAATLTSAAGAAVTVTATVAPAPTYSNVLNFDQPGEPTGSIPATTWTGLGITSLEAGVGGAYVDQLNTAPGYGWLGTGNVFVGVYGAFLNFASPVSSFSCQYWDDSGPGSFFGGGAAVVPLLNGNPIGDGLFLNNPAYGGIGASWMNIVATGGDSFNGVAFIGYGDPSPTAYLDNLSWNTVPAPGAGAAFGLAGIAMIRRRRA